MSLKVYYSHRIINKVGFLITWEFLKLNNLNNREQIVLIITRNFYHINNKLSPKMIIYQVNMNRWHKI